MATNEYLPQLENLEVTAEVVSLIEHFSQILPYIKKYEIDGDKITIIGLPSYEPKDYEWAYNKHEFKPEEVVKFTAKIEKTDKKIFYTVQSEDIESLAVNKPLLAKVMARQDVQVGYDGSLYFDQRIIKECVCELNNYKDTAKIEIERGTPAKEVAKTILTTARRLMEKSDKYNKRGTPCKIRDVKKLLLFADNELYTDFEFELNGSSTISIERFENKFANVISENLANNVAFALISADALAIGLALKKRNIVYDGYVDAKKILDLIWGKPFFVDYMPAVIATYKNPTTKASTSK